jgi:dTDP-4-amino-4,6-dideoxygalactose transaminase
VTADARLAERIRRLRQYGWESKYRVTEAGGINSRLDELQAAVLEVRLEQLEAENARRRAIAGRYAQDIRHPEIAVPRRGGDDDAVHLFVVRCRRREALREHLRAHGVATDVHYPVPDHRQPAFASRFAGVRLPRTEALAGEVLTLPAHPALTDAEVEQVCDACNALR